MNLNCALNIRNPVIRNFKKIKRPIEILFYVRIYKCFALLIIRYIKECHSDGM